MEQYGREKRRGLGNMTDPDSFQFYNSVCSSVKWVSSLLWILSAGSLYLIPWVLAQRAQGRGMHHLAGRPSST